MRAGEGARGRGVQSKVHVVVVVVVVGDTVVVMNTGKEYILAR